MKIDLELIQILNAIAVQGSFEGAAHTLHKVRSALSYHIQKYEEQLGFPLFDRTGHRAQLTQPGKLILEQGKKLLQLSLQIEESAKQIALGWEIEIRIAYDEVLSLAPILQLIKEFQHIFPTINLTLSGERLGGCAELIMEKKVDIAVGVSAPLPNHSNSMIEPIGSVDFVFAVAPFHPLAGINEPLSNKNITQYPAIVASDSAKNSSSLTIGLLEEQTRLTFSSMILKRQAQIDGLGVGFLPYHLIKKDIENGLLVMKTVERQKPKGFYYLMWDKTKTGKAMKWLVERLQDKVLQKQLIGLDE